MPLLTITSKDEWHADGKFRQVGFRQVGFDAGSDAEAAKFWKGVVHTYAFVVGLLYLFCVGAHMAVEVVAKRHLCRQVSVVYVVLQGKSPRPWDHFQRFVLLH